MSSGWVFVRVPIAKQVAVLTAALGLVVGSQAGVVLNEFMAASNERGLVWNAAGVPRLGSGVPWMDLNFEAGNWIDGYLPAGYGFSGLATDLTLPMKDKTPSLYLRKEFSVATAQAASSNLLVLSVQYNDGFVAYLNGREIARVNCGPTNHFLFAGQPAYNVNPATNVVDFSLGPASAWLLPGRNLLALQAHNAEKPSTTSDPGLITQHQPTPEFRINAGLKLAGDTNSAPVDFIPLGASAGPWRYWVGRAEPSGGIVDMGLITKTFLPPTGEEDDYDQPADFADWVELYNNGTAAVDLGGWSLTDDPDLPAKWRFPTNTLLPAGGCLMVLCDDRDEANAPAGPATRLHANFKLSDEGEYLALFDKLGQFVDGLAGGYPSQVASCSYGRNPTNSAVFGFLGLATPGTNNAGPFYPARVEAPHFQDASRQDLPGGIYVTQSMMLYLQSDVAGSLIRYTLNGSEPTEENGFTYTTPLVLTQPNEKVGVVVRARAFLAGFLPSKVKTHTYLLKQPAGLTNAPVLLFTADPGRDFYAPEGLMAIAGGQYVSVSSGSIWLANGPQSYNMALGNGSAFERGTHLEYFFPPGLYPTNQSCLRTDIGLRLSASGYSRPRLRLSKATSSPWPVSDSTEKPSFNLYFAGDFGAGRLDYPLFANYSAREFQHLRLRAGKNDITNPFITDELVRRLWLDMGHVGARGLFCSLYFNGVYKGVFNLCERFREPFFQAHYRSQAQWDVNYIWTWVDGDNVVYWQLLSLLDQNLTNLANWQNITNRLDIDNAADYYLLNIYWAMWDWPGNNFVIARERSSGPDSRFRFGVWDAEGAANAIGYTGKTVAYNTITNDLIVPSGNPNYSLDVARIFRRLATSPEFRLRFADRVNRHLFNGGVLDDRDPDGPGPLTSHIQQQLDALTREAGDLVKYNTGQTLNLSAFNTWIAPASGRRTYLLGNASGRRMLRDAGLWPVTEPPLLSQQGGVVPPGYTLTMTSVVDTTGQTATIYYTMDGTDPRLPGGTRNPAAQTYTAAVPLNQVLTLKARARNNTTGEWSPLTEATFAPAAESASATNLVLAELMYHPPDATAAELAVGFNNADAFEFVRLLNVGSVPVDLTGVRFTSGIAFDFASSALRYLSPGASALVVADLAAFQCRYGHACDASVAGEYTGNLANGGEHLQLHNTNGVVLCDFVYGDSAPWPAAADGDGPSLLLRNPWSHPDPADPSNWMASAAPGGLPAGVAPDQTYATWRALYWNTTAATNNAVSGPDADPDQDGVGNLLEYAFGLDPHRPSVRPQPSVNLETVGGDLHLTLSLRLAPGARDAHLLWETSNDLRTWTADSSALQLLETESYWDGTASLKYFDPTPVASQTGRFLRLRLVGP